MDCTLRIDTITVVQPPVVLYGRPIGANIPRGFTHYIEFGLTEPNISDEDARDLITALATWLRENCKLNFLLTEFGERRVAGGWLSNNSKYAIHTDSQSKFEPSFGYQLRAYEEDISLFLRKFSSDPQ